MEAEKNWREEKQSAYFYTIMWEVENHPLRKKLFKNLAEAAEEQANIWAEKIKQTHPQWVGTFHPTLRAQFIGQLLKQFGPERLRPILGAMKVRGLSVFNTINHEHLHRGLNTAGNLRAAVFGINDGLISNMSLLLGVAGANADHSIIVLTGVAGLLAGACSMASGEYVSVRSQREVFEYQIALEKKELELYPEEEAQELTMIYQARGIPDPDAKKLAELMISNPETGLDTLAREELGLNPNELGSPVGAMLSSFFCFWHRG